MATPQQLSDSEKKAQILLRNKLKGPTDAARDYFMGSDAKATQQRNPIGAFITNTNIFGGADALREITKKLNEGSIEFDITDQRFEDSATGNAVLGGLGTGAGINAGSTYGLSQEDIYRAWVESQRKTALGAGNLEERLEQANKKLPDGQRLQAPPKTSPGQGDLTTNYTDLLQSLSTAEDKIKLADEIQVQTGERPDLTSVDDLKFQLKNAQTTRTIKDNERVKRAGNALEREFEGEKEILRLRQKGITVTPEQERMLKGITGEEDVSETLNRVSGNAALREQQTNLPLLSQQSDTQLQQNLPKSPLGSLYEQEYQQQLQRQENELKRSLQIKFDGPGARYERAAALRAEEMEFGLAEMKNKQAIRLAEMEHEANQAYADAQNEANLELAKLKFEQAERMDRARMIRSGFNSMAGFFGGGGMPSLPGI